MSFERVTIPKNQKLMPAATVSVRQASGDRANIHFGFSMELCNSVGWEHSTPVDLFLDKKNKCVFITLANEPDESSRKVTAVEGKGTRLGVQWPLSVFTEAGLYVRKPLAAAQILEKRPEGVVIKMP